MIIKMEPCTGDSFLKTGSVTTAISVYMAIWAY